MEIRASQNLSNSACKYMNFVRKREREKEKDLTENGLLTSHHTLLSLSVGSIMSVPGTGHDIVGPWNP